MDLKTMQAAIEAKDLELATIKAERDSLKSAHETLTIEATAPKAQNATLATERDSALTELLAHQDKLLASEVDALVPAILDPAERDNFIALAKTSRPLFDAMIAQRKPRTLTSQIVDSDLPPAVTNSAVGADEKFNALVTSDAGV